MQEEIANVKHGAFSDLVLLKAMAIVNIFETGKPFGDFAACVVLNDGAGVSYGINQFTHRSGSLLEVVERYLASESGVGRSQLEGALPLLRQAYTAALRTIAADLRFRKALQAAAATLEMREAQLYVAFERYLKPAVDACAASSFVLPLSLAVIYDSLTHGSYERIRDNVKVTIDAIASRFGTSKYVPIIFEKAWIIEYVRKRDQWLWSVPRLRATRYRTAFFLDQIKIGNFDLDLPLNVHGFRLEDHHIRHLTEYADPSLFILKNPPVTTSGSDNTTVGPDLDPHRNKTNSQTPTNSPQVPTSTPQAQPPVQSTSFSLPSEKKQQAEACTLNALDDLETDVNCAGETFDQVDRIVTVVVTRTDRAKSLWTTVVGTLWQSAWALFGIVAGLPREVWLVVAVIAALLMLLYLYRQIALGKIRETGKHAARVQ